MANTVTQWNRPPIVEVVLGIQFHPLQLTNGHLGWFWGEMQSDFPTSEDAGALAMVVEPLQTHWGVPSVAFRRDSGESRLRMKSATEDRMLQVQDGWFVANWMLKKQGAYPGFSEVKMQFDAGLSRFSAFLKTRALGSVVPILWEVSYIDHIRKGTVWNTLADLPQVLPGLFAGAKCPGGTPEVVEGKWAWLLSPVPGRLQASVQVARTDLASPESEVLAVHTLVRGPITDNSPSLDDCLNFGKRTAVEFFRGIVSEDAQKFWQAK